MSDLSRQEMKILSLVLQKINVYKSRKEGITYLLCKDGTRKRIKDEFIKSLIKANLIQLKPPRQHIRHIYIGQWCINKDALEKHTQYKEIIVQIAIGVLHVT